MERPAEHLTAREAVLVVLDAAGGSIETRTSMQKVAYFAALAANQDLGHRAHFYGPYSRTVEQALSHAAMAGDISETVDRYPRWDGQGRDIEKYTYTLEGQGQDLVKELREANPDLTRRIDQTLERLRELVPDLEQRPLSLAAKADLIIGQQQDPIGQGDIPELARQLGWEMTSDDVQQAIQILRGVGRLAGT